MMKYKVYTRFLKCFNHAFFKQEKGFAVQNPHISSKGTT